MIDDIIDNLSTNKHFLVKNQTVYFPLQNQSEQDKNQIKWFLEQLGIQAEFQINHGVAEKMLIPADDFKNLQQACKQFQDTLHETMPVTSLTGWYEQYNDITADEWQRIQNHIHVKYAYEAPDFPQTESEKQKAEKNAKELVQHFKENLPSFPIINRIFHEFLSVYDEISKEEHSQKLTIDMSPFAEQSLYDQGAAGGVLENNGHLIVKVFPLISKNSSSRLFTFLHELRHVLQYHYQLWGDKNKKNVESVAMNMVTEAEAESYYLLTFNHKSKAIQSLIRQYQRNVFNMLVKENDSVPMNDHISLSEKIATVQRYIQAQAEERCIQTLCDFLLSKSRQNAYDSLISKHIYLNPTLFNNFMEVVDYWKNLYYLLSIPQILSDNTPSSTTVLIDFNDINKQWARKTKLRLSASPTAVFTSDFLKAVRTDKYITQTTHEDDKHLCMDLSYEYTGISAKSIKFAQKSFQEQKFQNVFVAYNRIQEYNPYFPPVSTLQHLSAPANQVAQNIINAMIAMNEHKSPYAVLKNLGYGLDDQFNIQSLDITSYKIQENTASHVAYKQRFINKVLLKDVSKSY